MGRQSLSSVLTQFFPPKPRFTEKDLPSLKGKVYIVTGSNTGVGKEVAQILYSKHAKVYIFARSAEKANKAIESIKHAFPRSEGELHFIHLDLNDLRTIKKSAEHFLSKETKLHVLFNNAGLMQPPSGSTSAQGYELQLGVNTIAPFLLTKLLTPLLISTARTVPRNTVRVVWVSSSVAEFVGTFPMDNLDYHIDKGATYKYGVSKTGNYLHAAEFAKRYTHEGIVSVPLNPGNLGSELVRYHSAVFQKIAKAVVLYPPIMGAYTELFAALSPEVTLERSGDWVVPFGRFLAIRRDLMKATKEVEEGGTGMGLKFWKWTEEQIQPYI